MKIEDVSVGNPDERLQDILNLLDQNDLLSQPCHLTRYGLFPHSRYVISRHKLMVFCNKFS